MNAERLDFFQRFDQLAKLLSNALLVDTFPVAAQSNTVSQTLRRGLTVSSFSSLETYLERVVAYLLTTTATAALPYTSFPDALRRIVTLEALTGIATRVAFADKADRLLFAETEIQKLAGFSGSPRTLSVAGFSPKGSNVGHEDVRAIFQAFGVADPWSTLRAVATAFGSGSISLVDDFKNASANRHRCAHEPSFIISSSDLASHIEACVTIAMAADILARLCGESISVAASSAALSLRAASFAPSFRFLKYDSAGSVYLETSTAGGRTYRRHAALLQGFRDASTRSGVDAVVALDESSRPFAMYWARDP